MIILGLLFLFLSKKNMLWVLIRSGYSLEVPHLGTSNEYQQDVFLLRTGENYPIIITKYSALTSPLQVNPMWSCRARSVYLTTRLLGRLSPLSGYNQLSFLNQCKGEGQFITC